MEIRKEKNELRKTYLRRRAELSDTIRRERDERICAAIISMASFRYADTILMYAPSNLEPDIMPVAKEAWKKGKTVAFPRCKIFDRTMTYHITHSEEDLLSGAYKIPEPHARAPEYRPGGKALCLVPALVYDTEGYRLGYGKGYYDRFLTNFTGTSAGIIYSDFISDRVPRGRFDLAVKILVTEKGVRITGEN